MATWALLRGAPARALLLMLCAAAAGCPDLPDVFALADSAALFADAGPSDGARPDTAGVDIPAEAGADAGCGPSTPGYGEPCGDCGLNVCDLEGQLICYDPGLNLCGVCGELDDTVGAPGGGCGSCGRVTCAADGLATECTDEHPPNECGGCTVINEPDGGPWGLPYRGPPGAACSSCGTGVWRCTADQNDLACFRGRGPTSCGGCQRCVLFHAEMDQRYNGSYIKAGTLALIEDTGTDQDVGSDELSGNNISLTFDPLVAGPGASALAMAYVFLWPRALDEFNPDDWDAFWLMPEFAASIDPDPSDPYEEPIPADLVRRYMIWSFEPLEFYRYVIIYDFFFETVISAGELMPGPPAELLDNDAGVADAASLDAGLPDSGSRDVPQLDAGGAPPDSAAVEGGAGDAAVEDAGGQDTEPADAPAAEDAVVDASAEDRPAEDAPGEDAG